MSLCRVVGVVLFCLFLLVVILVLSVFILLCDIVFGLMYVCFFVLCCWSSFCTGCCLCSACLIVGRPLSWLFIICFCLVFVLVVLLLAETEQGA